MSTQPGLLTHANPQLTQSIVPHSRPAAAQDLTAAAVHKELDIGYKACVCECAWCLSVHTCGWPTAKGSVLNTVNTNWWAAALKKDTRANWPSRGLYRASCTAQHSTRHTAVQAHGLGWNLSNHTDLSLPSCQKSKDCVRLQTTSPCTLWQMHTQTSTYLVDDACKADHGRDANDGVDDAVNDVGPQIRPAGFLISPCWTGLCFRQWLQGRRLNMLHCI